MPRVYDTLELRMNVLTKSKQSFDFKEVLEHCNKCFWLVAPPFLNEVSKESVIVCSWEISNSIHDQNYEILNTKCKIKKYITLSSQWIFMCTYVLKHHKENGLFEYSM